MKREGVRAAAEEHARNQDDAPAFHWPDGAKNGLRLKGKLWGMGRGNYLMGHRSRRSFLLNLIRQKPLPRDWCFEFFRNDFKIAVAAKKHREMGCAA
jgi:hypothetical protein